MTLTVKRIARLKEPGRYLDEHNLYLQIGPTLTKSWLFRYGRNGREHLLGLGALHTVNLNEAREAARRARQMLLAGVDPLQAKREQQIAQALTESKSKVLTFEQAAKEYHRSHEKQWTTAKSRKAFLSNLEDYAFDKIGMLPISDVDTAAVLRVIEPIWHTKNATANQIRTRLEQVLAWAAVKGHRSGDNPAAWQGHLKEALPGRSAVAKPVHLAALPYKELPTFMQVLRQREGIGARAIEFTILCATRSAETFGARWTEIDLEEKVWTIPASRMKMGVAHKVPLSPAAIALLQGLPREHGNPFCFIGATKGNSISAMVMWRTLARMERNDLTVHGFRSSFRDWASEQTNYPHEVCEMALAHAISSAVERAYRRGDLFDKRRRLMNEWSAYCSGATATKTSGKVVSLRG